MFVIIPVDSEREPNAAVDAVFVCFEQRASWDLDLSQGHPQVIHPRSADPSRLGVPMAHLWHTTVRNALQSRQPASTNHA